MARRNYKVYANLGITRRDARRFAVVLDTGAESSFIGKDVIDREMWDRIRPSKKVNIRDANNKKQHPNTQITKKYPESEQPS